jgi:hypothetical protein
MSSSASFALPTADLSAFDTLDIEGTVAVGGTGYGVHCTGQHREYFSRAGRVVAGQTPLHADRDGPHADVYGQGVLDASRFDYANRQCTGTPDNYQALSWIPLGGGGKPADSFVVNEAVITDSNVYATAQFNNGS